MLKFKQVAKGRHVLLSCLVYNCEFTTRLGNSMYDHLKIAHNFLKIESQTIQNSIRIF